MLFTVCERLSRGRNVILVHSNADMDAIGSAYALAMAFQPADIFAPNGIDRVSKIVVANLGIEILDSCDLSDYDTVVVVDTSAPDQLEAEGVDIPYEAVIVDHHMPTGKWDVDCFYCCSDKVSCCEIALDIVDHSGKSTTRESALALLCGMVTDSAHFQFADAELMRAFAELMDRHGICMDEVMGLTDNPVTISERAAVMKGLGNLKFDRVGDYIVATSLGGNYEASTARAIMDSGADVAFVASKRGDTFRISSRATQEIVRKGLHLGEIMKSLGHETDSDGGGHSGAAGISGVGDPEAMLHICMQKTMDVFRKFRDSERESRAHLSFFTVSRTFWIASRFSGCCSK